LITGLPVACELGGFRCTHTIDGRAIYADTDIVVDRDHLIGHTHHQCRIERGRHVIVNPGSVGQNRAWIDMVDYAIVDAETNAVELRSLDYDFPRFVAELRARRYPPACLPC